MTESKWQRKARALSRLAEDQRGKPEGELARGKLLAILNKHPEAAQFEPVQQLIFRDITLKDIGWMNRHGVSVEGRWDGGDFAEAYVAMVMDYQQRIVLAKNRRYLQA